MSLPEQNAAPSAPLTLVRNQALEKSILIVGDSLSAGHGIRIEDSWPTLLQARLGTTWQVHNVSRTGEKTAAALAQLPARLEAYRPSIVVIQLAVNDLLCKLSLDEAEDNMQKAIELSRESGAKVALISIRLHRVHGWLRVRRLAKLYENLVKRNDLPPAPFLLEGMLEKKELFFDGIHGREAAQPQFLDNVWPTIRKLMDE